MVTGFDSQDVLYQMGTAFALHEIIVDGQGLPVDYRFLEANPAFEMLTGLDREAVIGKTVLQVLPGTEAEWIDRFGKVALTGLPDTFTGFSRELGKHYQVSAFSPKPGQVAVTFVDVSDYIETQDQLAQQHRLLQSVETELSVIYQSTPVLMLVVDSDRRIVKVNQAVASYTGIPVSRAAGLRLGELFHCQHVDQNGICGSGIPCDSCLVNKKFLDALNSGSPGQGLRATLTVATDQGPVLKHLLLSTAPLKGDFSGQVLISIDDISALVQEQALHFESEERYQALVETGFDGILVHRQHEIIFLNQQMADMVGYSREELLGASALEYFITESLKPDRRVAKNSARRAYEVDLKHRDGRAIRAESFGVDCHYQGQKAALLAFRDVSARKEAEEKLRSSEQRYVRLFKQFESLLDAISDPITLLTPELELLWTNQAYDQLRQELGADDQGLFFQKFFPEGVKYPVQDCLETGQPAEQQVVTPDQRTWEFRAYPLLASEGVERQVITIATDITEKLRLREETSRSSRLAALGELAAGLAHEINNPDALILYNSDLLQLILNDLLPCLGELSQGGSERLFGGLPLAAVCEEIPNLLASMHNGAQRIKRIVDELRNFSHDAEGAQLEPIDLSQVARTAANLTGKALQQKTSCFDLELAADLPRFPGNSQRLEQVVVNLLLNSSQALESSEQQIWLKTFFDPTEQRVVLQVADQGRGIPRNLLDRLCEPFFTTRRDQGGTGLGLSVSARIVKEHNGDMVFDSEPGVGTRVTLRFPLNGGSV